nr:hypothetical protein [Gemmatimonadales bacterium]
MPAPLTCFATCAVGLEPLLAGELRGLAADRGLEVRAEEPGGIEFRADRPGLYAANLHLRTASRIIVRVGSFHASAFHELERHARRLRWETFVPPGAALAFRVSARKSRLYHQGAVAERLLAAVAERVPGVRLAQSSADDEAPDEGVQLIVVRLFRDQCIV